VIKKERAREKERERERERKEKKVDHPRTLFHFIENRFIIHVN